MLFRSQRALRAERAKIVNTELRNLIAALSPKLKALPHPYGFTDRTTGAPLTRLDYINFSFNACGAAGQSRLLKGLKQWAKENA